MENIGNVIMASESNLKEIESDIKKTGKPSDESLDQANEILDKLNAEVGGISDNFMSSAINEIIDLYKKILEEYR
ncbi:MULTISPECIES: hypothetical protein [Methanobacterium]|jgi:ribonucleotide monophosphatase NagD (HAD superfamily)|uniref:Uncharacterized protein n=1 Tax=Methanobacterium veterum TaxID=408577 RepID=A0A9E5A047_9EURY|nr:MULTISPECIES: hypothetical protein [Methanobacterium]MCZ3366496.1 hypothetical protein [Methanobacterium veterum]MCZ3372004.1 hypothetical protein [Methanobacterium veterum]